MAKEKLTATAIARTNLFNRPVIGRSDAAYGLEPGEVVELTDQPEVQSTSNDTNKASATFVQVKKHIAGNLQATGWVIKTHLEIAGVPANSPS